MCMLSINEVSVRIGYGAQTIRNRLVKERKEGLEPGTLVPRSVVLPGGRSRRWREADVDAWIDSLYEGEGAGGKKGKTKADRVRERQAGLREARAQG